MEVLDEKKRLYYMGTFCNNVVFGGNRGISQLTQKPTHPNKEWSTHPNSWTTHPCFWSTNPIILDDSPKFLASHPTIFIILGDKISRIPWELIGPKQRNL